MITLDLDSPFYPREDECCDERYPGATAGCRWCGADHKPGADTCHHGCGFSWTVYYSDPSRRLREIAELRP